MGSDLILVQRVDDVHDVARALQEAADRVLSREALDRLDAVRGGGNAHCHIYWSNTAPALGMVSLLVGGYGEQQDSTALFVTLYLPGHRGGSGNRYVPAEVINRLGVRLDGSTDYLLHPFQFDRVNSQARARLHLPTATFRRYPRALIVVR